MSSDEAGMKGYFITGTDTGVGKTHVTCALAVRARARGQRVFAFKPIETGCTWNNGKLLGADQEAVSKATGDWQQGMLRGLYQFEPAVAPFVAADPANPIDLVRIQTVIGDQPTVDLVLVEGAGGWRVPITITADMGSLAKQLGLPVLVVARAGLGTINHTLLTIEAVEHDGCVVAGVVLSRRPEDDVSLAMSNSVEIARRWSGVVELLSEDIQVLDCFT
jgi:dethiobiotin synthetase